VSYSKRHTRLVTSSRVSIRLSAVLVSYTTQIKFKAITAVSIRLSAVLVSYAKKRPIRITLIRFYPLECGTGELREVFRGMWHRFRFYPLECGTGELRVDSLSLTEGEEVSIRLSAV